ncbi:MAG: hypothetical protein Aurels2KO_54900 [Aureliella sp.]
MEQLGLFSEVPVPKGSTKKLRGSGVRTSQYRDMAVEQLVSEIAELKKEIGQLQQTITELRSMLVSETKDKESYTTKEVAQILGRKPYTVREWARLQRINAFKAMCGRGSEEEWRVSHEELVRIQNDGLLPVPDRY